LVNLKAGICGTMKIEQGLKPARFLLFFGAAEAVPSLQGSICTTDSCPYFPRIRRCREFEIWRDL
jgi:hypothetical protein